MSKPNVIVCLCDQLRAFEVGCYGNSVVRTPNIDRLAENGVRFETACSNNPVCSPSRASLLTGQYSRTCAGMLLNADFHPPLKQRTQLLNTTMPEVFRNAGYHTSLIGKWHIKPHPLTVGFDDALFPCFRHRYTGQTFIRNFGEDFPVEDYSPEYEIEQVSRLLQENTERPFFLYYNISPPHMPLHDVPEFYRTLYGRDDVPLRKNVWRDGRMPWDERWFKIYLWDFLYYLHHQPHTERLPDGFDLRDLTALYYGLTSWVDDLVGRLIDELKARGLLDNTLIVFTSDHGDNLGSHHLFNKGSLIEESIRIPLIFHFPQRLHTLLNRSQVASIVDVMPSVLGLLGIPIPEGVQGTDLSTVLLGQHNSVGENVAYIETYPGEIGIRTATHLYGIKADVKNRQGNECTVLDDRYMFFDLDNDPYELNNIAMTEDNA
ncbi:MAG TPA: sulfatase-like hydrolase/transferase, partial [bacterium]|nr:sulfatase-like hydrolase/transferase [bacterium]